MVADFQANKEKLQPVSGLLASLLVKYPDMQYLAQRAFITYLRSIHIQKDKEVFDVMKLSIDEFSASLGLPMTPKIRFLNQKIKGRKVSGKSSLLELENSESQNATEVPKEKLDIGNLREAKLLRPREKLDIGDLGQENMDKGFLLTEDIQNDSQTKATKIADVMYVIFIEYFRYALAIKLLKIKFLTSGLSSQVQSQNG